MMMDHEKLDIAVARYEKAEAERDQSKKENNLLRAALAQSDQPCVYCTLSKADWLKCKSGFPGCARADDAMGCPELGASLERDQLKADCAAKDAALQAALPYLWTHADMMPTISAQDCTMQIAKEVEKALASCPTQPKET